MVGKHGPVSFLVANGTDGVYDRVEYKYNRQSQRIEMKDQNGTIHQYEYDALGRATDDKVAICGPGVDGTVRRIERAYEVRGMVEEVTSYDAATGGSAVNEVEVDFDDFGLLATEYQQHDAVVNPSTSPKVQYAYSDGSDNHVRPTRITYPNGCMIHYGYGSGAGDNLGRVSWLAQDNGSGSPGTHLVDYTFLGLDRFVKVNYDQPGLYYDLAHGAGADPYDGLDRFGRIQDLLWYYQPNSSELVRIKHGYDRVGNRLWREDSVAAAQGTPVHQDELYTYDGVYQLTDLDRGDLNGGKTAVTSKQFAEEWSLDPTGNWTAFKQDTDGNDTWDLDQSRTHNVANEISQIDSSSTHVAHDVAGNMTRAPKPSSWSDHYHLVYDAWNRLVTVKDADDSTLIAKYEYDGQNRRTIKKTYTGGSLDETRHYYYSTQWQVLEERVDASTYADRQFIWGVRYIDDLILRWRDSDGDPNTGGWGKADSGLDEDFYAMQDANWNVVLVGDSDGDLYERYRYDAYGAPTVQTATFGSRASSSYDWETLYAGYRYDAETSWYHVRNRILLTHLGRWNRVDPIGYRGSEWNLYEYVGSNPTDGRDPEGLETETCNWTVSISSWTWAVLLGRSARMELTASATKDCCTYLVEGEASTRRTMGDVGIYGMGYFSVSATETNVEAACEWPLRKGSSGSVIIAGAGVDIGLPIGLSLWYVRLNAGSFEVGCFTSGVGWNIAMGGGKWNVVFDEVTRTKATIVSQDNG